MPDVRRKMRKAKISQRECVACGCCVKACPRNAIIVVKGIYAHVDREQCIGCGKCAGECPASVIVIREVAHEKALV